MIPLTLAEERKFQQAETYDICDEHLNYRIKPDSYKLPLLFHHLRGYDGHVIVKVLKKQHGKTRVIANHMESYMSFSASQLQFWDSVQFTNMPLEK